MLEYIRKNRHGENGDGGDSTTKSAKKAVYRGPPAPPNRYNIMPGARWDGLDRSNGFEKKFYESINSKKAREEEAYKWSIEDM
jgi:pre-mRNA-splicing factor CWC26